MTINYWAIPNMGKMHMMQLIEINKKSYTKNKAPYYYYKQWHDPDDIRVRIEKTFLVRRGKRDVETPIKTKPTFGQKAKDVKCSDLHEYLEVVSSLSANADDSEMQGLRIKLHSNTLEKGGDLMKKYFGGVEERRPPDILMKDKDPVEVFFTDKYICDLLKYFPVSPSRSYLDTFLEPFMRADIRFSLFGEDRDGTNIKRLIPMLDELCDVDFIIEPFSVMGRKMIGGMNKDISEITNIEKYVLNLYKSHKNIIPYKEDLIDCLASKLKRFSTKHVLQGLQTDDILTISKIDKGIIWNYFDTIVKSLRRIEWYFKQRGLEPIYFNLDRDDYKETFGFDNNDLPRTSTHPGDYPERELYEQLAKEYVTIRKMKDMRRRGMKYDWI